MKLNPKKCKEMVINSFMTNPNTVMRPICIGNQVVETVKTYKLLRETAKKDLKWNSHIDYIIAKAAKRLYALRLLKHAGVNPHDILKVYISNVRSILEYAIQVWQDIPEYLSDRIERIQKRELKIIFLECTAYNQALLEENVSFLANRRVSLCHRFVSDMASNHKNPISFLIPKSQTRTVSNDLRSGIVKEQ